MDPEPVFSPGHDPMPKDLVARREGTRRISPEEIYSTVVKHKLDTVTKFFAFAARQLAAEDKSWVNLCMKLKEKGAKEATATFCIIFATLQSV